MDGMTWGAYALAVAAIACCGSACSRHSNSPELAAIESAYHAGVLTKDEYTARVARLSQLAALDKALLAGVLTKEEYAAKKAALGPVSAPAPVDAVSPAPVNAAVSPAPVDSAAPPAPVDSAVSPAPAADSQSHLFRMKAAQIIDSQGFGKPIASASLLIPVNWQSQGATTWNIKDKCNSVQTHFVASGPDGHAFERFPVYNWAWADDPRALQLAFQQNARMGTHACDIMQPMSAQEYLRRNLAKLRPNAELVGFEPAPALMDSLAQQAKQTEDAARRFNLRQQVKYDAAKARVKYSVDGKPMEEWILAAVVTTGTLGVTQQWTYRCVAYTAGQRAPAGQLESSEKLFQLIASTFRVDPEWQARVTKNALAMQQIELKGIRDRSAIVAKSAEEQRQMQQQTFENRQNAEDRSSTQFSQYLRGVETYQNPNTGQTVDLDSKYGHAWVNGNGEYLLSDQANFDPNSVSGNTQTWTQLQHVKQ